MCLTKVYYNTYADGAQDITEKAYPCRDGRSCSRPDVRKYDRKFPFGKLGDPQPESHRSLSERQPTPYFSEHTPRGSKSLSPSGRRDSDVYMSGANPSKHYDYRDLYGGYDAYGYRHDPRDRYGRERERDREPRLRRSSTNPHIVYMDRDRDRDSKSSRSRSRSSSRDIPLGLVPLADEYGRRHHRHSSSSRSRSRDEPSTSRDSSGLAYYPSSSSRRRTSDPHGYILHHDEDERRRQRREDRDRDGHRDSHRHRRLSTSSYTEPSTSAAAGMASLDPYNPYLPRRASTVVHHSDGSIATGTGSGGSSGTPPKQLRWEDQVRARRERQNAEIASRPIPGSGEVKGILKRTDSIKSNKGLGKGKGREMDVDDIADLRRSIERMEIPRGRDREPRGREEWDGGWGRGRYEGEYGIEPEGRRKRSRVWADGGAGGYRY